MRPNLQFSIPCDDVGRTGDGKLVIYGVFEGIVSQSFPAVHRACYVANRWTGGTGSYRERVRIVSQDGKSIVMEGPETQFKLPSRSSVHTVVCRLEGLTFSEPGAYWVQVWLDDQVVCEYSINVQSREQAEESAPPGAGTRKRPPIQN